MPKLEKKTIESLKTVTISVLVTAIIAFVGGVIYADKLEARVKAEVAKVQSVGDNTGQPVKK